MTGTLGGLPRAFWKMSGAGNDFLVFPGSLEAGPLETDTIRRLCRRGTSVGADGVLFVSPPTASGAPVRLDYFNADGGRARFCANGTRCAARFAVAMGMAGKELVVETGWGRVEALVRPDDTVTLHLPEPVALGGDVPTFGPGERVLESRATAVSVGVPHLVVHCLEGVEVETLDLVSLGPPLRRHPELPDGANVSFVSRRGISSLAVRSWERGVEGETLSCGSGVVASAVVAAARGAQPPVAVGTRSGSTLVVDFRLEGSLARDVTLTGDARIVFEGTLREEAL